MQDGGWKKQEARDTTRDDAGGRWETGDRKQETGDKNQENEGARDMRSRGAATIPAPILHTASYEFLIGNSVARSTGGVTSAGIIPRIRRTNKSFPFRSGHPVLPSIRKTWYNDNDPRHKRHRDQAAGSTHQGREEGAP